MARHHFTLAALATSAVPGLELAAAQPFTGGGTGAFDAALLTSAAGEHLVVRVPLHEAAARGAAAELRALEALTPGARHRLPFAVAEVRGVVLGAGGLPAAFVTTYLPGQRIRRTAVRPGSAIAASLGTGIAAVHALPTAVAAEAGLPTSGASETRAELEQVVRRAAATGRVPQPLLDRWETALGDAPLWRFQPTLVHGALTTESLLSAPRGAPTEALTGVLHWAELRVADPARDLAWALSLGPAAESVLSGYVAARHGSGDREVPRRAVLHAELELARWLLHGVDGRRPDVVSDAETLLGNLARSVEQRTAGALADDTGPILSVGDVERMLDHQELMLASTAPVRLRGAQSSTEPRIALDHRSRSSASE